VCLGLHEGAGVVLQVDTTEEHDAGMIPELDLGAHTQRGDRWTRSESHLQHGVSDHQTGHVERVVPEAHHSARQHQRRWLQTSFTGREEWLVSEKGE
jgi:hypothetical protein